MLSFQIAHEAFIASMWCAFFLAFVFPTYWVLLGFTMPRSVIDRYLKEPYFTWAETTIFSLMPGKIVFAGFTAWVLFLPNLLGKKRRMTDAREHVPAWYKVLCAAFLFQLLLIILVISTWALLILVAEPNPNS